MSGALSWLAPLVSAGASIYGAYSANQAGKQQQQAAQQAAQQQAQATQQAQNFQQQAYQGQQDNSQAQLNLLAQMYNQNRADNAPYRAAGQAGLQQYQNNLAMPLEQTPGYQWQQQQAQRAVLANAAANRNVNSGTTLRALQDRAQGIAGTTYGDYMNRLAALSGIGQTANTQGMQASQMYGQNASGVYGQNSGYAGQNAAAMGQYGTQGVGAQNQYLTAGAGAAAGGQINAANALMGGANSLLGYYMQSQRPGATK